MLEPREAAPKPASEHTALELPTFHDDLADLFDIDNFDESAVRSATPWWRRRVVMVVAGILIVVLIASFAITAMARGRPQPVTYQTAQVVTGRLLISVSATGTAQSAARPAPPVARAPGPARPAAAPAAPAAAAVAPAASSTSSTPRASRCRPGSTRPTSAACRPTRPRRSPSAPMVAVRSAPPLATSPQLARRPRMS